MSTVIYTDPPGYFAIPAEPSAGITVTSGSANAFGASWTELEDSTTAAIYIVGLVVGANFTSTYVTVDIAIGAAAAESSIGVIPLRGRTAASNQFVDVMLPYPIPVATSTRISAKTADSTGSQAWSVKLICINQADVLGAITYPSNFSSLVINGSGRIDLGTWLGSAPNALSSGRVDSTVGAMQNDVVTAASIASNAITSAKLATNAITQDQLASNTITAAKIASDAITAAKVASDVSAEIADAVWDEPKSGHTTAGTYGQSSQIIRADTAQNGASTTITLDASASASDDFYNGMAVIITAGTGKNQVRYISDYVGATKVATVDAAWAINPASGSQFMILG